MKRAFCFLIFLYSFTICAQKNTTSDVVHKWLDKSLDFTDQRLLDSSEVYLKKADELLTTIAVDSVLYYKQKIALGALTLRKGDSEKALAMFLPSLGYFKAVDDRANLGMALYQMGICNYFLNRRLTALSYFERAQGYERELPKKVSTKILQNLGSINLEEGMAQKDTTLFYKAIESYEKVAKIYVKENWIAELSLCTSLLSECYIQLQQLDKAISVVNKAINYGKQANNSNFIGFALIKKNSILNKQKRLHEALQNINEAIDIYQKTDDKGTLLYAYNQKKRTLDALGKYEEASTLATEINGLTVTIYNQRLADGVTEMEAKYKTAEKEKEIAEQKLKIKNKDIFSILLGGTILMILVISFGLYKRQRFKRKQLQKELALKDVLAKVKTQNRLQEQRLRISQDLHDNIGSQLTFITSSLDNLKFVTKDMSAPIQEKLTGISDFTIETIDQLRDTIWAMNKNEITSEDLHGRMLNFIKKATDAVSDIHFNLHNTIQTVTNFSAISGMHVFRIFQEGINNALKHANASKMDISLEVNDAKFQMHIQDNGSGFNAEDVAQGNGLKNMRKRAQDVQGTISIASTTKGTHIVLTIPLINTTNDV